MRDLPPEFQTQGLSDRLDAQPGNCFEDALPANCDCVLFCHFLTIWSEDENRKLLKKVYDSLPSRGRVVVFNMMQWDDETGPLTAAMGSPYFLTLATGKGMLYTANDYEQWMSKAGFATTARQSLPLDHAAIIGCKRSDRRSCWFRCTLASFWQRLAIKHMAAGVFRLLGRHASRDV